MQQTLSSRMGSIQEANTIALLVQAILYGIYVVLVILALRWLLFDERGWKLGRNTNGLMLAITVLFFGFSTVDLILSLFMTIVAMRGETTTAYNRYGAVINIIEVTTILTADAVLISRCWLVYAKSRLVIFMPVLLWLVALSCSILVICSQIIVAWESRYYHLWVVFYSCNILTNIYATAAIIWRISQVKNYTWDRQSRIYKIARILFESGLLYTLTSCMNLVSAIVGGPPMIRYVSDAVNFSMTGITFNLILIRVHWQRSGATDAWDSPSVELGMKSELYTNNGNTARISGEHIIEFENVSMNLNYSL